MGLMPRSAGSPAWRVTGILVLLGAAFGPATVHGQEAEFLGNDTQGTDVELKIGSEWDSIFNRRDGPVRRNQAFRTGSNPDGYLLTKLVLYMNDFASSDHVEGGRPELRVRLRSVHNRTTTRDPHSNTSEIFAFAIPTPSSAEAQDFVPSSAATETQKTLQPDTWYAIDVHQAQVTPAKENNVKHIDMVGTASDAYSSPEGWQVDGEHLRKDGPSNRRWSRDQNSFRMKIFATRISDATTVTLTADPGTIAENGGQATIRGSVAPAPETAFTVDVAAMPTADTSATASDYTLSSNTTLSFAAGATASTGTVTLTAVNDDTYTGDRSVTLSGTSTAEVDILAGTVAIEEDEPEPAPNRAAADPTHNSAVLFWVFEGRPDGSDVEYQVSANDESFGNWTEIPLSRPGQSHGSQYEVPDLAPSTEYTFKLRYKRGSSTGPEVEASATTFEPFTARFTKLPAFRDALRISTSVQEFTVEGAFSSDLRPSRALAPIHGRFDVDGADYRGRDDGRDLSAFWLRFWAKAATTSVAITLKAPDGPKVRCTVAEADVAPIRKLCSADLRPLSEDVTGIVRAEREVRLALDTASISENGGVANLTARLHKPRSWGEASTVNETSDVDVYVDVQITDKADDIEVPGTRLTIPAGSRDSNAIALTALDNDATSGNRRIAIAAGTPSEGHVTVDSQTGSVELEIREDDQGLLAPDDFEATPGPEAVRLSWDPSVNMFPHAYEYRYWSTGTAPDWQYIPDSDITEANHSSFTISELARQTSYTFEIRATTGQHQSVARSAEVTTLSEYSVELEPPTHFLPGEAFEVTAVFGSELLRVDGLHHEHTSQVVVQGGTYERLEREGLGRGRRAWDLTIQPDSGATEVTVSVVAEPPPQLRCASDETERICSADRHPLTQGASVTVPVYAAPAFDAGLPASVEVAENTAADTDIGSPFTATDADNDILTWTLDGTDKESFAVDAGTGQLKTKAALDYEARSGYSVTVGVSDGTNSDTHDVSVSVTDVDEPPVKPAAPTVHSRTGTSLTVDWTAPSNEGKPAIESYDLQYRAAGSEGGFTAGPQDVSGTRAQITPLLEATSYQVQVRATNPDGDGEWSDALAAGTDPAVSIAPGSGGETVTEGTDDEAVFVVSRTGVTTGPLTVAVSVTQQGDYIDGTPPAGVTIGASAASAELRVAIDDDDVAEADGSITATVQAGAAYSLDGSTAEATVTVQDEDELALNVNAIAGDDTINIAEKAAGFAIAGDTGSDGGVDVTVTVGGTELTTVSGAADPATWSVSVPGNASYITGPSVEVSVSAARTGVNISPSDVARTLTVDLSAPQAPTYTAPVSLQVGVAIAVDPSGGAGIDAYGAEGLPSGLGIDTASGAIGGTPDSADEDTAEVTVTVSDTAGNADTVVIEFPAVEKGDQALAGFQYSSTSVKYGGAAPTVTGPTGAKGALSYSASPDTVCTVNAGTGALTIIGVGRCEVTVTAAGTADYNEATDTFTVEVQPANTPATGAPTISGTALVGERLTAAIDDIADADGLPRTFPDDYTVQWMRVDSDGASNPVNIGTGSSTYILVAADQGKKIKVEVSFQDDDGNDEERTSAAYPSGMETVGAAGPQTRTHVPAGWSLIPSGLGVGDDFRLLFVTSTRRTAGDTGIGAYNAAVRGDVSSHGHTGVQGYSAGFNVLGCTASISAIANTKTASTDPAAPIYWLNGNKVADDYADLYDGSWDSNAPKYSDGTNAPAGTGAAARTFVGCESTGESSSSFYLGASSVGLGYPGGGGSELGTGTAPRTYTHRYYGLSGVFRVVGGSVNTPAYGAPAISGTAVVGQTLSAARGSIGDADGLPSTFPDDYTLQWMRVDSDGASNPVNIGTNSGTYALVTADVGKKIKVEVSFQDTDGNDEVRTSAAYPSGAVLAAASVAPPTVPVTTIPAHWSLKPAAIPDNGTFRLLFVTGNRRTASATAIGDYDQHVQARVVGHGGGDLRDFSALFKVLGCTATVDARDHTGTTSTDTAAPIYWVDGDKVADDYADLYDGRWDSNAPKNASGNPIPAEFGGATVFTGCLASGTRSATPLGATGKASVTEGLPEVSGVEIEGRGVPGSELRKLYGLSSIFRVAASDEPTVASVAVTSTPLAETDTYGAGEQIEFTVTFSEPVEVSASPPHFEFALGPSGNTEDKQATYQGGSGTTALVFAYTVLAADSDDDGIWIGSDSRTLKLDSGEYIRAVDDEASAILVHSSPGTLSDHKVDGSLAPPPATDATLGALSLGTGVTLLPEFASATTEYRAWVANSVASVTVTATTNDEAAAVAIADDDDTATPATATLALAAGRNTVEVTVTAEDTSTIGTYTVTVVRAAAAPAADPAALLTANLTVGETDGFPGYSGFTAPHFGAMSDTDFEVDGVRSALGELRVFGARGVDRFNAETVAACFVHTTATPTPTDAVRNTLVLSIGGESFRFDAATAITANVCYEWVRPAGLSWRWGDIALVKVALAPNAPATGTVTITGTAEVGQTLTVSVSGVTDRDGVPSDVTYTYQWVQVDGPDETDIAGATSSTYTLAAADQGKKVKVEVAFTDDEGNAETLTSEAYPSGSDTVAADDTEPTLASATVTGDSLVLTYDEDLDTGSEPPTDAFTVTVDSGDGAEPSRVDVSGKTVTLTLASAVTDRQTVTVTYTVPTGTDPKPIRDTAEKPAAALSGQAVTNNTAAASTDATLSVLSLGTGVALSPEFAGATTDYRAWVANSVASVTVTATKNDDGATVAIANDDDTATPGTATLALDAGRNTVEVTVTAEDTTTTGIYTVTVVREAAAPTEDPAALLTANLTVGERGEFVGYHGLEVPPIGAMTDTDFEVDQRYELQALAVFGATGAGLYDPETVLACFVETAKPTDAVRDTLILRIGSEPFPFSASTAFANTDCYPWARPEGMSWSYGDVALVKVTLAPNAPATGAPTISGTAEVGETLTAATTGIEDDDGLSGATYSYQWSREDSGGTKPMDIDGATSSTYVLDAAEEGKRVKVKVTFTDDAGNDEALTSAAYPSSGTVRAANNPATGAPTISGTAEVEETLTAATTGIEDDDGLSSATYSYQWSREDSDGTNPMDIDGATSSTYALVTGDLGKKIKVRVSFEDDGGNAEALTSAAYPSGTDTVAARTSKLSENADATLSALSLGTGVTLDPAFASATTDYRAWVANPVDSVTVTATKNDAAATVAIADDDDTATPATATLPLDAGRNTVEVTVTAEDTSTTGPYTVTVVRAAAAPTADPAALLTANLTVGERDGFLGYRGFFAPHFGAMSDTDFEVDGVRSALGELRVFGASGVDQFNAETVAACFVDTTATPTPTDAVRNTLVLSIGGESFRFDAATAITANVCYEWVRPAGLSWRWGDIALVKVALAPNAPATPAAPTVETPTDTVAKLAVSWTEPGLNGGPDITGYAVQYREDGSEQWLDWTHSGTDTSATLTGLRPVNKLYQVRVRALNGETASDWSDEGSGRTGLPANAGPLPTGATEIWSAMLTVGVSGSTIGFSDGSYGTLSPDNFDIDGTTYTVELLYKSTGGTFAMQIQSGGVDADLPWHQALHLALEIEDVSDTYWTFSLADDTHAGVGTYATSSFGSPHPVFASGHDGGETAAVKLVTTRSGNAAPVFGADTATREVPENMAANADVGAVVTATDDDGDTLTYTLEGTDAASFAIDTSSGRIKTKAALDHETKASYSVTVKADDGFGGTDTIDVTIEVTNVEEQAGKPAAPTVEAPADSVTSLDVSWTAPELNGGPEITGYEVQYLPPGTEDEVEDEGWLDWTHTGTDTSTTITALTERTEYKVRVRALNGDTPSEWSDAGEGTTGTLPPNATGEPAISGAAVVGVMLTASPGMIEDEDGLNGASYSYHWIRVDEDGSSNAVEIMGATSSTYTLTPADEGKKVKVTASFNDDRRTPEARTSDPYPAKGTVRGPAIAIAPSQSKATGRFDLIVYTLERTGPTTEAAAVTVTLAPPAGNDWGIPANNLSHDVAFGAGESSKRLFISLRSSGGANVGFSATATTSGTLVASLSNVTGYDTTDTAEVEVVVTANPSWIVKLTQSSFSYAEGGGAQTVTIEAYAASADMPAPSVPLGASFVTEAGTASSPGDYAAVSEPVSIAPAAFSADADGIRRGQSTVTFTPEQDSVEEGNETLSFKLSGTSNDPSGVVQYEGPDGTRGEEATYPVTIIDDEDDTTPPELSSATVDRTSLVLTYNEDLDTDSTPAAIAFRVMVAPAGGGEATRRDLAAGNPVMVSGKAVTLTLVSAVVDSETVTVSYTVPTEADANYIRDKAEINAAALANRAVTNESPDTTDPMFLSATINRTSVVLTFNEALDESSVPAASAFLVIPPPTLTNVAVSGRTVTFTATPGYEFGYQGPFLRYTKPSPTTGPIQDLAGNHASDYLGLITNITPDAPELVTATVNGASLVLRYDRALAEGPVPEASAFTVTVAGSSRDLDPNTPVTVNGPRVTLALSSAVTAGQTVTVSYIAPPNNPIVDTEGNVALALTNQVVTNETTEPMLQSATVNGDSLVLTYDEALDEDSEPPPGAFTVSVDSGPGTAPSTVDVSGTTVTLTLVSAVTDGQTVTVSYTVPPTNRVRNLGENDAAALSGRGATNVTLAAPANLSALADSGLVDLTWDPPASDTDVTRHEYRYRDEMGGAWPETWTEIPDSARDAANEGSYRVTGLSDGATYEFQLRAANDRGPGGTAEVTAVVKLRLIARFERRVLNNLGLLDESHPVRSRGHVRMVFKTGVVPQGLTEEDFEVINGAFTGFQIRNTVLDTVLLADTDATEITIALDEDAITNTGGNVAQQMTYAVLPQPAVTLSTDVTEPVTGAFDIVLDFNGPVVEDDGRQELFGAFAFTSVSVTNGATGASAGLATGSTRLRGSIIPRDDFEGELTVHVPAGKFAYWDEFAVLSAASNRLRLRVDTRFPKVVSVAVTSTPSASRDTYAAGEKIELTVTFSEEVEVSTDRPHFEFALGPSGNAVSKEAAYETGSGTTALVFAYTVQESDSDPDGIWVGDPARTLVLESGEYIRSAADMQDAVLDHAELGTQAGHNVDGSLTPGVPEVSIAPAQSEVTEGTAARFELTRVGRLGRLTVAVSVTETGSMIAGTAPAQAVFDAGARSVTLTVLTTDDSADEAHSTVSAEVGAGTGYTTGPDATARVLVKDDDAGVDFSLPVGTFAVPLDWDLNPPGLVVDDSFRLLIVTSTRRTQFAGDIAAYDTYVRNNVRNTGHTAIREYGAGFRVVGCTSSVDADDHTATTYSVADPGVPIYWLDGDRVAGDFRDFYDGAWDSNAPRYPDGTTVATSGEYGHVLTGCTGSGQRLIDHTLGSELPEFGVPGQNGRELESTHTDSSKARSFYGLSPLFRITGVPFVNMVAISSTAPGGDDVYETGDAIRVTVTFNEAVTVDTLGGTPELALTIGERTRNAAYSAGDSSATALVFTYTVVAQDSDEDGVSVAGSALMLIGSAIHRQGDAAVAAATALRALPGQAMHRVTTPPMLQSAAVDGASLVLTYDEDLDEGSVPPRDAFTVSVAGAARALAANDPVDVSGKTVTLTLATAAEHGQTVTVTYTVPTGTDPKPIRDVAQNNAAALAGQR